MVMDHRNLRAFQLAHALVLYVYRATGSMPKDEQFAMRSQIRRAAVSVPTNIVEGRARRTQKEFVHFLNIALGSASELRYLLELAHELAFLQDSQIITDADAVVRTLAGLIRRIEAGDTNFDSSVSRAGSGKREAES